MELHQAFLDSLKKSKIRATRQTIRENTLGFELFRIDLSNWKLGLSNRTPLLVLPTNPTADADAIGSAIVDIHKNHVSSEPQCIALCPGDGSALRKEVEGHREQTYVVVIDDAAYNSMATAPSFSHALMRYVSNQLPVSRLSPYKVGGTVTGNRFFGRETEADRILHNRETNFAITGVRRIGKTSLMSEVCNRYEIQGYPERSLVWLDCSPYKRAIDLVIDIVREVSVRDVRFFERPTRTSFNIVHFLRVQAKAAGVRLTIFLDEIDALLRLPRDEYDLPTLFRAAVNAGSCRLIVTGFETLMSELSNKISPFYLFFEEVPLKPFTHRELFEAVLVPLRNIGIRCSAEDLLLTRIREYTNGHPILVQLCCVELLKRVEQNGTRMLQPEWLDELYFSEIFKRSIVNTFRDTTSARDKLLICSVINFTGARPQFTESEIYIALKSHNVLLPSETVDQSCDRLVGSAVLERVSSGYRFVTPMLPQLLSRFHNVPHLIEELKEEAGES